MSLSAEITLHDRVRRRSDVIADTVGDEAVLVTPSQARVRMLNETGSRLWALADGNLTVQAMADVLAAEYDVTPENAAADALAFMQELLVADLVEIA